LPSSSARGSSANDETGLAHFLTVPKVSLFIAGDGVSLLKPDVVASLEGKGTGKLAAHLQALKDGGARLYLSGMSAKARGLDESILAGYPAEFAMPDVLVRLAAEADTLLCY
jgi:uncharacterized protein